MIYSSFSNRHLCSLIGLALGYVESKNHSRKKNRKIESQGHATHDGHRETYIELLPLVDSGQKMGGGGWFKFSTK